MTLEIAKNIALIASATIATLTFFFGYLQFRRNLALQRAQFFTELRKRREQSEVFRRLIPLLDKDDEALREIPWEDKIIFTSYYKDVALLVNSKLMRKEVAFQMFGNHAVRCWQSEHFWEGMNRQSVYFELFKDFAESMAELEESWSSDAGSRSDKCLL